MESRLILRIDIWRGFNRRIWPLDGTPCASSDRSFDDLRDMLFYYRRVQCHERADRGLALHHARNGHGG